MELNRIELKKITHDFNIISSRMMRAKYDEYNIVLKKFIAFIERNEIINDYILSGKRGAAIAFLLGYNPGREHRRHPAMGRLDEGIWDPV